MAMTTATQSGTFAREISVSPLLLMWRALVNVVFITSGAYAISVSGFYAMRWTVGEAMNCVSLFNNVLHLLLLPAVILLPLALIFRRWLVSGLLVLPFTMALVTYAPLFIGAAPATLPGSTPVRVLSYNLLSRAGGFDDTLTIIREADADIELLQELSFPAADAVQFELSEAYPYMALHPMIIATQGQGIISRYPLRDVEYFQAEQTARLGHQRGVVAINGKDVVVYNVHTVHPGMTNYDTTRRTHDLLTVLDRAEADAGRYPVLLGGDFNLTPLTEDYVRVTASYTDAFQQVGTGLGYTFPDASHNHRIIHLPPLARIDYVFHDASWQATEARVWERSGGSDHRPLYVELALLP